MRHPSDAGQAESVYRRIIKSHWKERGGRVIILPDAFIPNNGLSVFNSAVVERPRAVFEDHCRRQTAKLSDTELDEPQRAKIEKQLAAGDLTPEGLYRAGWRIVELPTSLFPPGVFAMTEPEEDGHQNVTGREEDFISYAADHWVIRARMLSEAECL